MSISTTATKDSYAGNNSIVTQYPITFKYFEESHISVYFDGVLQTKGAGADYVMGGDGTTSTGYITTNVAQAGTVTVAITLDVPFDQPVVLQETGSLPAKTIEVEGFDRLNMQIRRVWRKLGDVLTFSSDEGGRSTGTADNLIGFNGSGDIAEIPNTTFVQTADGIGGNGDVTVTTPSTSQVLAWNGSAWVNTTAGNGDAVIASGLDQFAATTSSELAGVISDKTGTGALVFATSPALVTPDLGTPSAVDLTNATNTPLPASDSITYDMVQDVTAADKILGSVAGGTVEEIACTSAGRALLDDADAEAQRNTLGANLVFDVRNYGTVGNGTTDDRAAIQAAIDAAEAACDAISTAGEVVASGVVVDLAGGLYAITDTLTVDKNIKLQNGSLVATQAMTGTTASSTFMLKIRTGAKRMCVDGVDFDGGLSGTTKYADLIEVNAERVSLNNIMGIHFPSYGIRYIEGQESRTTNVTLREWLFSEAGTTDDTLRTAKAFSVEDADMMFTNCVAAQSLYPFYVSGALNQFVGCHAYNGGDLTPSVEAYAVYLDNADNNIFTGCYFDNGNLYIKTSFNHNITGCHFQKNANGSNDSAIFIDTAATDEEVVGLNVVGCTFNGSHPSGKIEFGTTATGTYIDDLFKKLNWIGNIEADGTPAWYAAKEGTSSISSLGETIYGVSGTDYTMKSGQNIRISADYDNNSSAATSKVILATDGTDRYEVGSSGELLPSVDNSQVLGGSSNRLNGIFSNKMVLMDGVTAPNTITGHASIYVDTADGYLKVKFGDGTVKTITTDTP